MYIFGSKNVSMSAKKPFVKPKIYRNVLIDMMYSVTEFTRTVLINVTR